MKFQASLANRLCKFCGQHDAKFTFRGRVKRDREHNICFRCYRSLWDGRVARQLSAAADRPRVVSFETSSYFYRQLLEQPWARKARPV